MSTNTEFSTQDNWLLICSCLRPDLTENPVSVPDEVDRHARFLCDGMGKLTEADLSGSDHYPLYDWSHVRDSSDEAVNECGTYLRRYLRLTELARKANEALAQGNMAEYEKALEGLKAA